MTESQLREREPRVVLRLRAAGCVYAEEEARLLCTEAHTSAELEEMVQRRVEGEPLEVIVGWAEFHGLRVHLEKGVFVPRRRTEFLVDRAIELCGAGGVVVDLCCGAGALGVAVATAVNGAYPRTPVTLYATDVEHPAVECARRNVSSLGGSVYEGDLFEPLPRSLLGRVDVLLANVPYVPSEEIALLPPEARDYEPRVTLDGGADGLDVLRRVAADARAWLAPGGHLFVEASARQAPAAARIVTAGGLHASIMRSEDEDATVIVGMRSLLVE
jgi:release factor glutamine methyltransferase